MMPANCSGRPAAWMPEHPRFGLCPSVPLVILATVLCVAPASARQAVPPQSAPRVPGFDIPPAPQPPPFPVLTGVVGTLDAGQSEVAPPMAAPQLPALPTPATAPAAMVPPSLDTWDQTVERLVAVRSGHGPNDVLDASVWLSWGMVLIVALATAGALVLVAILLNRGSLDRRPAPVVRAVPHDSHARRVDRRQSVGSDRHGAPTDRAGG
jgi:hypothetical protein